MNYKIFFPDFNITDKTSFGETHKEIQSNEVQDLNPSGNNNRPTEHVDPQVLVNNIANSVASEREEIKNIENEATQSSEDLNTMH